MSALVERLDISLDIEGGASIHVYQLGNAIAEEVAKTLNDAIQHAAAGRHRAEGRRGRAIRSRSRARST